MTSRFTRRDRRATGRRSGYRAATTAAPRYRRLWHIARARLWARRQRRARGLIDVARTIVACVCPFDVVGRLWSRGSGNAHLCHEKDCHTDSQQIVQRAFITNSLSKSVTGRDDRWNHDPPSPNVRKPCETRYKIVSANYGSELHHPPLAVPPVLVRLVGPGDRWVLYAGSNGTESEQRS